MWSKSLASAATQTTGNMGNSAATKPEGYYDISLDDQLQANDMHQQALVSGCAVPNDCQPFPSHVNAA